MLRRGKGVHVWDADGNRYTDLNNNFSSLLHGHRFPPVHDAALNALSCGTAWPALTESQVELAELLLARLPAMDRLRLCNSGSEAAQLAYRIARRATGRSLVLTARHGYHGLDVLPEFALTARFNDLADFARLLENHGRKTAAVFIEPVQGAAGIIPAKPGFVQGLAELTRAAGAVFVLDEVVTFRLGPGGEQTRLDLRPDLTVLGKSIGGGFPIGAVAGRTELIDLLDPRRTDALVHAGTFNGNPVSTAAGVAAIRHHDADSVARLDALGRRLADGLTSEAARLGLPFSVRRCGSLLNVYLANSPPLPDEEDPDERGQRARFHLAALTRGVFLAPRGFLALSTPMDEPIIDECVWRCAQAMADVLTAERS
jgi:glutamate-1-semialdehyde 2,1-aminomutase